MNRLLFRFPVNFSQMHFWHGFTVVQWVKPSGFRNPFCFSTDISVTEEQTTDQLFISINITIFDGQSSHWIYIEIKFAIKYNSQILTWMSVTVIEHAERQLKTTTIISFSTNINEQNMEQATKEFHTE